MSFDETIIVKFNDNHADIILNRPEVRNALNVQMVMELKRVLTELEKNSDIKTIALTGAGTVFCSGADINSMMKLQTNSFDENLTDSLNLGGLFSQLYHFPKPTIAIVNGPALAGGCGLATLCDFVLADSDAIFGYPEVRIGFVAAIVSSYLIRQVGERFARELLLTGRTVSAEYALKIGLINDIVTKTDMQNQKQKLINDIQKNSMNAMRLTKELLAHFKFNPSVEDVTDLADLNARVRETDDFKEGVKAFIEKRKPNWVKN